MSSLEQKYGVRNSRMSLHEVYFWTDTIKSWCYLLEDNYYKQLVINSWKELVHRKKIAIYGFVIMPNHLHVLWEMLENNGKEMPSASFNKFTSHEFLKKLRTEKSQQLIQYQENDSERKYPFWQRDPLAVHVDSKGKFEQKLEYVHLNPLQEKWSLVVKPEDYCWSSSSFYETGHDEFNILTHYKERF